MMGNFIKKIENNKYFDISILISLIFLSYFLISIISNHVGLYYDSVNPDFLCHYLLNKIKETPNIFNYIYLGQLYHGLINGYVMALVMFISGAPSETLLHFVTASYNAIICCMIYKILNKCGVDKIITALLSILLSISTALLCINITQFYIELSGMVFEIFAINFLINYIHKKSNKSLFLVGLLSGIACYGYYNFVFFVPAYLLIIYLENKNKPINNIMIYFSGLFLGIIPYVIGYNQIRFSNFNHNKMINFIIVISIILWIIYTYKVFKNNFNKKKKTISIVLFSLIVFFFVFCYGNILLTSFMSKSSMSNNMNLLDRIFNQLEVVKSRYFGLINSTTVENRLLGHTIFPIKNIINYVSLILFLISFIHSIIKYKKTKTVDKRIVYIFITIFTYFFVAFFIAISALSEQHFVPMLFIDTIMLGISIQYLLKVLNKKYMVLFKIFISCLLIVSIFFNIYSNKKITNELFLTGGINGAYSLKINDIAYEAMDKHNRNIKEMYVFEEWGYNTSFVYLTKNLINSIEDYEGNIKINKIIDNYIDDYQVVLICQNEDRVSKYLDVLNSNDDVINYTDNIVYERNGKVAYHKIIINKKEK